MDNSKNGICKKYLWVVKCTRDYKRSIIINFNFSSRNGLDGHIRERKGGNMIGKSGSEMPPQESGEIRKQQERAEVLKKLKEVLDTIPVCEYRQVFNGVFHRQDIVELIWLEKEGKNQKVVELDQRGNWQDNLQSKMEIGLAESSVIQIPKIVATNGRPDNIVYKRIDRDDDADRNVVQTEGFDFSEVGDEVLQHARKLNPEYEAMTLAEIGSNLPESRIKSFEKFYKKREQSQKSKWIKDPEGGVTSEDRKKIQDHYQKIIKNLLDEGRIDKHGVEYVNEKKIESRMNEIKKTARSKGLRLSYDELYGVTMFSFFRLFETLPKGNWRIDRLVESFDSSLATSEKVVFVAPGSLLIVYPEDEWSSETEDDISFIFKDETPRFTRDKNQKEGESINEMKFGPPKDHKNTEGLTKARLDKFVPADRIALDLDWKWFQE